MPEPRVSADGQVAPSTASPPRPSPVVTTITCPPVPFFEVALSRDDWCNGRCCTLFSELPPLPRMTKNKVGFNRQCDFMEPRTGSERMGGATQWAKYQLLPSAALGRAVLGQAVEKAARLSIGPMFRAAASAAAAHGAPPHIRAPET
eukprot:CAMPEP_0174890084 /NCGR_PEP_ID=MMETSP0167-20121228/5254_1 /TAXON_ID=38298 /ORGANISM="Rhodella maculata, Strain CCMP736" /LENGTH=146 /DNA_ID=CAMNT_0016127741 /DNA_START=932 /DNA_END=1372 /DNA_ORIENTATION=-